MTSQEVFKNQNIYFGETQINGINCSVAYIKEFRLSWMATQLNLFIIIGKTEDKIEKQTVDSFSSASFQYALKNSKGWPRGFQAAIGSVAILQGSNIDNDAKIFCEKPSRKHWSAFEIPVIYDVDKKKTIRYTNTPMWGAIYFPFFSKTIDGITKQL